MFNSMPPTNPRKRPAPGASPQMTQNYPANAQMSNADYMRWGQTGDNSTGYADPTNAYNMNSYVANGIPQASYDQALPNSSTQLARRPINRQLVQTAQRYDNTADPWGPFGDDPMLDPQGANGMMEENDNIEALEERAAVAKRDAQSKRKQIPPFVQKLSSFLDESKNTELIRWSDRGDSFVVLDEDEFAKTLIPELFKHNNYASFVRQLNMYGFHKRVGLSDNSMKASERKNKSPSEYYNPYFKRGHPNLLWLINKPKGGQTKTKVNNRRVKAEEEPGRDSDDEMEVEEVYGNNIQNPRAISAAPEAGALQRRDVAVLQNQLAEVQKQQGAITNAIARLRKDHNQLYNQAVAFQTLHDRHESSINAILTFLATVYNRSLDGQGPQNFSQLFANGIPHDAQQGSVVDIGEMKGQDQQTPGNMSPHRRQQRLLMAPPNGGARAMSATVSASNTPQPQNYSTPKTGAVEEVYDSPDSSHVKQEPSQATPQNHSMMNIIQNTNAQSRPSPNSLQFPDMLNHYQNQTGQAPLTNEQRNQVLNLMVDQSTGAGSSNNTNNAMVSPTPPLPPDLDALQLTQSEIDGLMQLQHDQESRIQNLKTQIEPLSPGGIPGYDEGNSYFNSNEPGDPNVDLDQFLDTGAFYNGSSPLGGTGDYSYNQFGDGTDGLGGGDSHFDMGMDGSIDDGSRVVEQAGSSGAATPENGTGEIEEALNKGLRSPSKRRKKN